MNLTLGCKEQVGNKLIYWLKDGTKLTQEEWTSLVEKHIRVNANEQHFEQIQRMSPSKRWSDMDTSYDFALQRYAAKYCTNVEREHHMERVKDVTKMPYAIRMMNTVKDEFGCEQFTLI